MWWLYFFNFVLVILVQQIKGSCRESFMTICDSFADLETIPLHNISEITIGSEISEPSQMTALNSTLFLYQMRKLKGISILGRINDIKSFTFRTNIQKLNYFTMYGNIIKTLKAGTFGSMQISQFKFINNNLENIESDAFYHCRFESVDLSHNKLEQIKPYTIADIGFDHIITKEMNLRHNKINTIGRRNCFPSGLEILNLDYNKLGHLEEDTFKYLVNLQEFTLNHNEITTLPNLSNLTKLRVLDASYNKIQSVKLETFDTLTHLEVLDLSQNQISNGNMFETFNFPPRKLKLQIGLSFNHLHHLVVENTTFKNHIVFLYGNPFNCKCWDYLEEFMADNIVQRNKCDLEYFGNGNAPYCIRYMVNNCSFTGYDKNPDFTENDFNSFLKLVENGNKDIKCSLAPQLLKLYVDYFP